MMSIIIAERTPEGAKVIYAGSNLDNELYFMRYRNCRASVKARDCYDNGHTDIY